MTKSNATKTAAQIARDAKNVARGADKSAAVKAVKEAKAEFLASKPASFAMQWVQVIEARNIEQASKDNDKSVAFIKSNHKAIDLTMTRPEFAELKSSILKHARIAESKQDNANFIGVKVMLKVAQVLNAISTGLVSDIDNHTKIIGFQLAKLQQVTNKTAQIAQTKSLQYTALDRVQELDRKHTADYKIGTTGTQTSSTRMMFKVLGICNVVKNKRNDVIEIQDNPRSQAFGQLFAKQG